MMAALGLGGVGALAMKALGVSMMALMLAAIIGIKKLAEGGGHDDGGHHVQYVTAHDHHHRKRRDVQSNLDMPYRGWQPTYSQSEWFQKNVPKWSNLTSGIPTLFMWTRSSYLL